tara:strand:+ start:706 stop:1845 length:1140 start_codon:yes stop_codon:yes gene_type:complete
MERANNESNSRSAGRVDSVIQELNSIGVSSEYINGVLTRLSSFDNDSDLAEAIDRELYKAAQFSLMEDDDEDATGKGSEDASGKGSIFARPVAKKGAESTLKGKKSKKEKMVNEYGGSMKNEYAKMEHLEALFSGENLTASFKQKAASIFEAAVNSRVEQIQAELVRQSRDVFVEEVATAKADMTEKLDDYMNYVVSEWMTENELAIDSGIQTEVTESFMNGLRDLFESHYIEVPESKVDLVNALTHKVDALTGKLNESIHENVQLSNAKTVSNCDTIFEAACHGLASTEIEKFKSLARGIEYQSEEEFSSKLATIKESYFSSTARGVTPLLTETVEDYTIPSTAIASAPVAEDLNPRMSAYFNSVGRLADHERQNTQS